MAKIAFLGWLCAVDVQYCGDCNEIRKFSGVFGVCCLGAHLFDASATFVALTFFSYAEKHVLPTAVMGLFGPVAFFALKLLVIIPAIIVIDQFVEDKNTNNGLKFVLFVLGFAPGVRDLCRMIMVC
ncbi:MAG: hypothetical protein CVU81_00520 [Euryarchaeota archaeon HGW-Euryarchaeota-1]|nr:MAG: hypothetical protein CVU81_00520 [Euryarchaeota archaeon HGW-Euryarchaeota-1]